MARSRGKRLSRSNVIGEKGEFAFGQWALDHHLSPNKVGKDLGVDFFCQVMLPIPGSESSESSGSTLAAQVKTVAEAEKPRLKLTRVDAEDLLRQTHATCLFGLRLSDNSVRFQFITKEFIDRLLQFLETDRDEFSIAYGTMPDGEALFKKLLRKYVSPFQQMQLRVHLIRRRVTKAIPGADLAIQSTDEHTVCRIYVPRQTSALDIDPSATESVRLDVLRHGYMDPQQTGVTLHPIISEALTETQSTALVLVAAGSETVEVSIRWRNERATERFFRRAYETEIAYVHRAGLRLTWNTQPERMGDRYVHAMEMELFHPGKHVPLMGRPFAFFRLFRAGAVLSLRPGWDAPISGFGEVLEHLGDAVDPIPHLCKSLRLPFSKVALADINDEEFGRTAWILEALLLKNISIEQLTNGFIVGPAAHLPTDQIPTSPILASVPLVVNWKEIGIVIWLECDGEAFLYENLICGLRLTGQRGWQINKTKRFEKSVYPELWIARLWPPIPIGSNVSGSQTWTFDPRNELPLEAAITTVEP